MTRSAVCFTLEQGLPPCRGRDVEAARRRWRLAKAQLVLTERGQLRRDEVWRLNDLNAKSRIAEVALSVHLGDGDVCVPIRHRSLGGERFLVDTEEAVRRRQHERRTQ